MATAAPAQAGRETQLPANWSLADLHAHLGGIPLDRIRLYPPPGTATLADAIASDARKDGLCELIDGILVEKTVGWYESMIGILISHELMSFVERHGLGKVLGTDATLQILPHQMRMPDVCFIGWSRFPDDKLPREPMPELVPELAVEVLSQGNTKAEMDRKLREYFEAGVRLVWYVDPETRSAQMFSAIDEIENVGENGSLDGRDVLPGLTIPLAELFGRVEQLGPE